MIYFTSDLHMNNNNVIRYCNRPYQNAQEMNQALIHNWNSVVKSADTVYVLGDFIMGAGDTVKELVNQFNGKIILIRGNHDTEHKLEQYAEIGVDVRLIDYLTYKELTFIMCHYPIQNFDYWNLITHNNPEIYFLYGHIHNNAPVGYHGDRMYHVGVDTNNYTPISIEQIYKEVKEYEKNQNDILLG